MTRDMTKKQFDAACEKHGFIPSGFMSYYKLVGCHVSVSARNGGKKRRDQLSYLIRRQAEQDTKKTL